MLETKKTSAPASTARGIVLRVAVRVAVRIAVLVLLSVTVLFVQEVFCCVPVAVSCGCVVRVWYLQRQPEELVEIWFHPELKPLIMNPFVGRPNFWFYFWWIQKLARLQVSQPVLQK